MYEQDIELAKLLLEKLTNLAQRGDKVRAELLAAQQELDQSSEIRDQRSSYTDILSRAAALLDRPDLQVESPETSELEQRVQALNEQLQEVDREAQQYRGLIGELEQRAPDLVSVASERAEPAPGSATTETAAMEPEPLADAPESFPDEPPHDMGTPEHSAEEQAENPPVATAVATEEPPAATDEEPATATDADSSIEALFSLESLKAEQAEFGRNAAIVIDATSVIERVPLYDRNLQGMDELTARDRLIRNVDRLSQELSGSFYLVFSSWHQPLVTYGNNVSNTFATGTGEGTKDGANRRLRQVVSDLREQQRRVCVVTGDRDLAESLSPDGVRIVGLGSFFNV